MAKITCKTCRRLEVSVCGKLRCALQRKPYPPGEHGRGARRSALSEYGAQLKEKQIVKFSYGLREAQFQKYVKGALAIKDGKSGDRLVSSLERRLDNVVYRLRFAQSRHQARQIVSHGHIYVNNRRVTIPSFTVRVGDIIQIRPQSIGKGLFKDIDFVLKNHKPAAWLELDKENKKGQIIGTPYLDNFDIPVNLHNVMEFYSR